MKKELLFCSCLYLLAACSPTNEPLIEDDMIKLTIECTNTNGKTIEIHNQKTIIKVIREINNSRRESTAEMEFDLEHRAKLENSDGEKEFFNLFTGGKAVVSGYYIHSNIDDFCEK